MAMADVISAVSHFGAEREFLRLMDELNFIKNSISMATKVAQAGQLKEADLEGALNEVVCDLEDIFQSSMAEMAAAKARNIFFRQFLIPRIGNALARNLKSIRYGRLEGIRRRIHTIKQTLDLETNQVNRFFLFSFF